MNWEKKIREAFIQQLSREILEKTLVWILNIALMSSAQLMEAILKLTNNVKKTLLVTLKYDILS